MTIVKIKDNIYNILNWEVVDNIKIVYLESGKILLLNNFLNKVFLLEKTDSGINMFDHVEHLLKVGYTVDFDKKWLNKMDIDSMILVLSDQFNKKNIFLQEKYFFVFYEQQDCFETKEIEFYLNDN
jgi:hypothetical protein